MKNFLNRPWGPYYTVGESLLLFLVGVGGMVLMLAVAVQP